MTVTEQQLAEWLGAGQAAIDSGRYVDAAMAFSRVQQALPGFAAIAGMAGQAWQLAGNIVEARLAYREVFAHTDRADIPALYDLGATLLALGAPDEARSCFELVATARGDDPAVWSALASATRAAGDPVRAWPLVERALSVRPDDPGFLLTAGQIRHALGDLDGASTWLERAAARRPQHAVTTMQQAFTSLLHGANAEGWRLFEARRRPAPLPGTRDWHGESLENSRIVVLAEQGLGDQFHFIRFVRRLQAYRPREVLVAGAEATLALFRASGFPAVSLQTVPEAEWSVPLLSLPFRLGLHDQTDADSPYLTTAAPARPVTVAHDGRARRRLGLVWKGNPEFAATVLRDLDDALLRSLTDVRDVDWVSLQYGVPVPPDCPHVEPMPATGDWLDTARLLDTLDGVVTVDTSVAHLAGAMHKRVYLLVPYSPDWRWGLGSDRTPWYPTMVLVRQPTPRDWEGTIPLLHRALDAR